MPVEKPFKICNDLRYSPLSVIQQHVNYTPQSTMKDCNDLYELRIYTPYAKKISFCVFIEDHVLNISMSKATEDGLDEIDNSMRIFLPLDVNEALVNARIRPYGIKIVLPKKKLKKKSIRTEVPVFTGR
jgi:hypothetical protein